MKTQKEKHRKAVHCEHVGDVIENDDLEYDEIPAFDIVEDGAVKIIGRRNGLYLMQYVEHVQWMSLSDDHHMVKEFEEDAKDSEEMTDELPVITRDNLRKWFENKVITEDEPVEEDFH